MKNTIEINTANFEAEVLQSAQPVLVDFWAEWCGPCKMIAPVLEELGGEYAGRAKITKVNVDQNPELAERYRVQAIPTLLYFANGKLQHQSVGASGKKAIVAKLDSLLALPAAA